MSEKHITDAEWDVMQVVWSGGQVSAADVISELTKKKGWNHRTVRTLLSRLVDKEILTYEVDGNRYVYKAQVTRQRCVRTEGRSFVNKVFGGDVKSLLLHFVDDAGLDAEDLKKLREALNSKKRS
jgi:BlaI family penicillinase repressor